MQPTPQRRRRSRSGFFVLLVLVALILCGTVAYGYATRTRTVQPQTAQVVSEGAAEEETRSIVARVGKHVLLPEHEEPTLATVTDPERLQGQAFFKQAKVGDKILIYTQAKKVILYDPHADIVVEMSPLTIDQHELDTRSGTEQTSEI